MLPPLDKACNRCYTLSMKQLARKYIPIKLRREIFEKYGFKCNSCGIAKRLTIDHIVSVKRGGTNAKRNLQVLCVRCNYFKLDHRTNVKSPVFQRMLNQRKRCPKDGELMQVIKIITDRTWICKCGYKFRDNKWKEEVKG